MALSENSWVLITWAIIVAVFSGLVAVLRKVYAEELALNLSFYENEDIETDDVVLGAAEDDGHSGGAASKGKAGGDAQLGARGAALPGDGNANGNKSLSHLDARAMDGSGGLGVSGFSPAATPTVAGLRAPPTNPIAASMGDHSLAHSDRRSERHTPVQGASQPAPPSLPAIVPRPQDPIDLDDFL